MEKEMRTLNYNKVEKFYTIKEMMELAVEQAGDQNAFMYRQKDKIVEVKYKEFQDDTFYLGTALADKNLHESHVAVIGDNSYNWITVYLTMLKTNGVIVPVDKELPVKDIIGVLKHSDSKVLFYGERFEKNIEEIKQALPEVEYFIGFERKKSEGNILSYKEFKEIGKKLYNEGNTKYTEIETIPENLRMLVYTSGTTGKSKGVMLTEKNLVSCVYYGLQVSNVYNRCLSVLPYHHTYEAVAGLLVALHKHVTICINDNLKNVLKNLQTFKPDYIYVVPAFAELFYKKIWATAKKEHKEAGLKILIGLSNFLRKLGIDKRKTLFKSVHNAFGGNLRKIVAGGAPIRPELGIFFDSIGIDLINGYGITECSPLVSANMDDFNDPRTVGMPLLCCSIKLEDITEDGEGEICVKGDIVMKGYYKNEELTNEVLKKGWFHTGDYGKINEHGQLLITGRKKNLIVLDNGKNVFPEEIENYIMGIEYVQEVVVRGIKNEQGEEVALLAEAFLNKDKLEELKITDEEKAERLKKDILNVCKELPLYKKISKVEIREKEFNKTTTNKIIR